MIEKAIDVAEQLEARFPDEAASVALLAQQRQRSGDASEAIDLWKRCLRINPHFVDAYVSIGSILIEHGEYDQAETILRNCPKIEPAFSQAVILLGSALMSQGKTEETVALLERDTETSPPMMPRYLMLGQAYLQLRQYERAREQFTAAIRLEPEFPNAYYGLATACARLGLEEESTRHSERFRELESRDRKGQLAQARRSDDTQSESRNLAETYLVAGRIYLAAGDYLQAEEHWRKAADCDPGNGSSLQELQRLYQQQGRRQDAREIQDRLESMPQKNQ